MHRRQVAPFLFALAAACTPEQGAPPPAAPSPVAASEAGSTRAKILGPEASPITFERMAKFPEPGWNTPRAPTFSPDGKRITFLASEGGGDEMALFEYDVAAKSTSVILRGSALAPKAALSREEELRRERQRQRAQGITSYRWAKKTNRMLVPFAGDLFLRRENGQIARLTNTKEPEIDGQICPTGERVAFVRGSELFTIDVATKREVALTSGAKDGVTRGLSDYNGQEEFDEESGFFWSPTCDKLLYLEVDERKVGTTPVVGYRNGAPDSMTQRYPEVGKANPIVKVGIVDVTSRRTTWVTWPDSSENYFGRFQFTPDGKSIVAQRISRDQKLRDLVRIDAVTGKASLLFSARDPAWVRFATVKVLEKEPRFVVLHDVGGHEHLELRDAGSGSLNKSLTQGKWDVSELVAVDEARRRVIFTATRDGVREQNLYAVSFDGGEPQRLAPEPGVHHVIADASGGVFFDVHSAAGRLPRAVVRDDKGAELGELPVKPDADLEGLRIRPPKFVEIQSHDVALEGALLEPRDRREGVRYPAIVVVYGGPDVQTVLDRYSPRLLWQHLADRGFVVFQLDNRGSFGRGHAFEAPIAGHLGVVELEDQLAGLAYLKSLPFVDSRRVGIYGHSYGGFMAANAMLRAPGDFKAGIAASPVTDWRLYDTGYTERFMGLLDRNRAGYEASDLVPYAKDLKGDLLLIHALMDENVHFANTARLIDALVAADKHFDFFAFPGERHGYRNPAARAYQSRYVVDYFAEHLQ